MSSTDLLLLAFYDPVTNAMLDRRTSPVSISPIQKPSSKSTISVRTREPVGIWCPAQMVCYTKPMHRAVYTLAHELLPGRFRPTQTHSFVRLLDDHKLLHTCFTQNIDTLERRAGVPGGKVVEAHGSFAGQRCIECRSEFDGDKMRYALKTGQIAKCPECEGLVKPDIVFFGESVRTLSRPQLCQYHLIIFHCSCRNSFTNPCPVSGTPTYFS